jgi:hypothetical protein
VISWDYAPRVVRLSTAKGSFSPTSEAATSATKNITLKR